MEKEVIEKIWFEIKNMPPQFWGYDGMEGLVNAYELDHSKSDGYVKVSEVLAIIERHLQQSDSETSQLYAISNRT